LTSSGRGKRGWEHFGHGADIGVRGFGPTLSAALAEAGNALTAVVCDPALIGARAAVEVACQAPSADLLLVDWLNAIVYEMATRRMLFSRFDVRLDGLALTARLLGEPVDRERHQPAVEVKGATHTALRVAEEADGTWVAQCVVDV
jgi:tRNA nucleotidyltransferase (CCA-adding enzyme)